MKLPGRGNTHAIASPPDPATDSEAATRAAPTLVWLFRRVGPLLAIMAALAALKWPAMFDLDAYLAAARAVAAGQSPYAATLAMGVDQWGTLQVYVSPPFVAHVLAPFSGLPTGVVFAGWTATGLLAVIAALRLISRDTLVARAPLLLFSLVYVWGSIVLGQVNLFTLAGLLLAFGSRSDRLAGFGLALAILTRAVPGAFAVVFVLERRWRPLGWAACVVGAAILVNPADWIEFLAVARQASGLPTLTLAVVQTSLAPYPPLWFATAAAVVVAVGIAVVVDRERVLRAGTVIGLALLLLPTNAWHHWLAFLLAPLLLFGDDHTWSRRLVLAFVGASFITIGWVSSVVAVAAIGTILVISARDLIAMWPQLRRRGAGILRWP